MPYADMPWVKNGRLITAANQRIEVDTPAWFRWLQSADRFCYTSSCSTNRLTARKEKRRRSCYWYGYIKKASKLHNIYLGKSEYLTAAHLDWACEQLAQKARR
jgi:hypothetical protein